MSYVSSFFFPADLYGRREVCYDGISGLTEYRFEQDNGLVEPLRHARTFVQHWPDLQQKGLGMLFWGPPGTGKTFAAACIANHFLESRDPFAPSVVMTTFGVILRRLVALNPQDREDFMTKLLTCRLLILDDFGMERQTDFAREQVFNIINGRYLSVSPTVVTTNLSLRELKNPKTMADHRIYDRLLERCLPVCFDGESLRREKAAGNLAFYRSLTAEH